VLLGVPWPGPGRQHDALVLLAADAVGDSDEATYTISPLPARRPVLVIANQSLYQEHLGDEIDRLVAGVEALVR